MNTATPQQLLEGGAPEPQGHTCRCLSSMESTGQQEEEEEEEEAEEEEQEEEEEEEEREDYQKEGNGFSDVPLRRAGAFRAHSHTHDPFKRHSWGPGRELQDPLGRRLQASGCPGPEGARSLQSREELDALLGAQLRADRPSRPGPCCHLSMGSLDPATTRTLCKSVSMSGINCLLDYSDPEGNLSQSSATDLSTRCGQLEGGSGTWAGSSLRRTFSFLLGMTGKAKYLQFSNQL